MNRTEKELQVTKQMNQELKDIIRLMRLELNTLIGEQERKLEAFKRNKFKTESVETLILQLKEIEGEATHRWAEFKASQAKNAPSVKLEDF